MSRKSNREIRVSWQIPLLFSHGSTVQTVGLNFTPYSDILTVEVMPLLPEKRPARDGETPVELND